MIILRPEPDIPINSAGDIDLLDGDSWPFSDLRDSLEGLLLTTLGLGLGLRLTNCGPLETIFFKLSILDILHFFNTFIIFWSL